MDEVKKLARELNLVEVLYTEKTKLLMTNNGKPSTSRYVIQPFDYILVIDFESTCWETKSSAYQPEIIEFPGVLFNINEGKIETLFQQYVMPIEHPKLSKFCCNLTGITQEKVDNGFPLNTTLMLFSKWLTQLSNKYKLTFPNQRSYRGCRTCVCVTWSDWDLGICLPNECRRKQIMKPEIFSQWIDLRALYREFYQRRPQGLKGALSEVGLPFAGDQHCGLDDAKNTAFLAYRMVKDGAVLRITKDLNK